MSKATARMHARREKVAALHAQGMSRKEIAEALGVILETICIDLDALGLVKRKRHNRNACIDEGLAALTAFGSARPKTYREIAEACNCSHEAIRQIEQRALKKLRARAAHLLEELHWIAAAQVGPRSTIES